MNGNLYLNLIKHIWSCEWMPGNERAELITAIVSQASGVVCIHRSGNWVFFTIRRAADTYEEAIKLPWYSAYTKLLSQVPGN